MVEFEFGVVTGYVPSLKTVGFDIATALNKLGHPARCFTYQIPYYRAKKLFQKAIVFMPFDPIYIGNWIVMAMEYSKAHIPTVMYVTVEGIPKKRYIKDWMISGSMYYAVSEYVKEMLEEVGVPIINVIYHGVNLNAISQARENIELNKELMHTKLDAKVVFGTVCSDLPRKGLKMLSQVAKLVETKIPDAKFYVFTKTTPAGIMLTGENIHVEPKFGTLKRIDILKLIGSFDYYLCPSFSEGFGLPLLEAHAMGVPVICGEYKPLIEVTCPEASLYVPIQRVEERDDGYGILFTYHLYNAQEMADRIIEAYEIYTCNKQKYDEMVKAGMIHAEKFDILKTYSKFIECF